MSDEHSFNFYSLVPRLLQAMPAQLMPWSLIRFLIKILRTTHCDPASLSRWLPAAILMAVSSWRTTGRMSSWSMEFSQMWKLLHHLDLRYHFIDMLIQVTPFTKALYPPLPYPLVFSQLDNWQPHQSWLTLGLGASAVYASSVPSPPTAPAAVFAATTSTTYTAAATSVHATAVWEPSTAGDQPTSLPSSPLQLQPALTAFLPRPELLDTAPHATAGDSQGLLQQRHGGRSAEGKHEDEHEETEGHRRHGRHQVQPVLKLQPSQKLNLCRSDFKT